MPPYRYATRIPTDLPYVLRPGRVGRVVLPFVAFLPALLLVVTGCAVGARDLTGVDTPVVLLWLAVDVVLALLGLGYWRLAMRPGLAADERGLWVCARRWPVLAIWLPWDAIDQVERCSGVSYGDQVVLVLPRDPDAGRGLGALATVQQGWADLVYGSRLIAKTPLGTVPPEVLDRLARLAGRAATVGRCRITLYDRRFGRP